MVKNVTVTVVGEQRTSREENNVEPIELVTSGSLHEKDGVFYLKTKQARMGHLLEY